MAGRIARMVAEWSPCRDLQELEDRFVSGALDVLAGDCLAWNNWAPDWSSLHSGRLNRAYEEEFLRRFEAFQQTVGHHPVVVADQFQSTADRVVKLTDFQSAAKFRENPLYREVYRHLDSRYQIAFTPSHLPDRRILLTLNRSGRDFSRADEEALHFTGACLDGMARAIEDRRMLDEAWREICEFVGRHTGTGTIDSLRPADLGLLRDLLKRKSISEISQARSIRRDSVDRRMGAIRERLGLENHRQLLSALAELQAARPPQRKNPD